MEKRMLITGASGFTGRHACAHFEKAGYEVVALTRNSIRVQGTVQCDLTNKTAVMQLIKEVQPNFVLHLAGQNHVGHSWEDPINSLETNAVATAYVLEAIRQVNESCKVVVAGSALQFDFQHPTTLLHPYSLSKTIQVLLAQAWVSLYGMNVIIAKPSNLIGPGFSNGVCSLFAKKIVEMEKGKANQVIEVNSLKAARDFIDVRDAVSAYEILFNKGHSGEIYDISSGKSRSLADVLQLLSSLTRVDIEIVSQELQENYVAQAVVPEKLFHLGWQPTRSFTSSLQDILDFYRQC